MRFVKFVITFSLCSSLFILCILSLMMAARLSVSSVQPGQACTPALAATGCAHLTETDSFQIPKDCGQHFFAFVFHRSR